MAMLLKINQDAFDALPDTINPKDEYKKQEDGTYLLDGTAIDGYAVENVAGLKSSLAKTLEREKDGKKKLKEFEGLDVEKAREALAKMKDLASGKLDDKSKAQVEAAVNAVKEKAAKEIEAANAEAAKHKSAAIQSSRAQAISDAIGKHEANPTLKYYLESVVKPEFQDDGSVKLRIHSDDGSIKYSSNNGSMDPMSVEEHVAELKQIDSFGSFFPGSGASGSGASGTNTNKGKASLESLAKLPPAERMKQAEKMGINK